MGDQCYMLKDGEEVPVEVSGSLLTNGWLPGTWVKYATGSPSFNSGAIAKVDISDGTGTIAGFLITGPQHKYPIELESDMWTTDTRQRDGGDNHADWTGIDAGNSLVFDAEGLLQHLGTRLVTMYVPPTGFFKFYVFEVNNKAERNVPGSGAALTYAAGDKLYVSENGKSTSEQETVNHVWTGYVVARYDSDFEGNYIICCAAVA